MADKGTAWNFAAHVRLFPHLLVAYSAQQSQQTRAQRQQWLKASQADLTTQ
jgi:hypothetical protein